MLLKYPDAEPRLLRQAFARCKSYQFLGSAHLHRFGLLLPGVSRPMQAWFQPRFGHGSGRMIHAIHQGRKFMSSSQISHPLLAGIHRIRSSWGWFLALGIVLIILGVV